MRKIIFVIVLTLIFNFNFLHSQSEVLKDSNKLNLDGYTLKIDESDIMSIAEEMPRFPGCENWDDKSQKEICSGEKLLEYVYSNLKYPEKALKDSIQGRVYMKFAVSKEGFIFDITVLRDIGGGCGAEAQRVIESMNHMNQRWTPGKQYGRKVNVYYSLPVIFKFDK